MSMRILSKIPLPDFLSSRRRTSRLAKRENAGAIAVGNIDETVPVKAGVEGKPEEARFARGSDFESYPGLISEATVFENADTAGSFADEGSTVRRESDRPRRVETAN